jgi:hypothetical protein
VSTDQERKNEDRQEENADRGSVGVGCGPVRAGRKRRRRIAVRGHGTTTDFNFRDISVVNGIAGGAGVVTSGPHAGAQAGFQLAINWSTAEFDDFTGLNSGEGIDIFAGGGEWGYLQSRRVTDRDHRPDQNGYLSFIHSRGAPGFMGSPGDGAYLEAAQRVCSTLKAGGGIGDITFLGLGVNRYRPMLVEGATSYMCPGVQVKP